ncbi:MAG: hypothetical protein GC168_20985 [Candidatus Hydrogenedens sp.]|nr:hypothetical protein [Candidatus Hydrogenedens sp.]
MLYRIACVAALLAGPAVWAEIPADYKLIFEDDFSSKSTDHWEMTDPKAWEISEVEGNAVLELKRGSRYEPAVRSPKSIAWLKGVEAGSFVLEATGTQTGREYGHRDLCFFFGRQDASHFYYVHLATKADDHANSTFLVNGEPRVSIAQERTDGTDWTTGPHKIRIVRDAESGSIEVYFDDMDKPVMKTVDKTFVNGAFGLGSFDDVGQFDDVKIWAPEAPKE